jgi:prepilin-type N-terminal cleavage/methylation domain-containing protein
MATGHQLDKVRNGVLKMRARRNTQAGFTLLETMLAAAILLIAAGGVLGLFSVAMSENAVVGDRGTRTTEYAQDKMEQLMALTFSDTTSDVTQYPTCLSLVQTCTGSGLTAGGSVNPASPSTGYVDYVSANGAPSTSSANAAYIREWSIVNDSNTPPQMKTITVVVQALNQGGAIVPSTTLVSQKASGI